MNTITNNAKRFKSRDSLWTLALRVVRRVLVDLVTVIVAAAAVVFTVAVVDWFILPDVVVVVDDPRNKDGSTLCFQPYEIDVAKPIRLFTMSKIE
jgi:hypothetical protein